MRDLLLPSAIALIALYCATNPADATPFSGHHRDAGTGTQRRTGTGTSTQGRTVTGGSGTGAAGARRTASAPVALVGTVTAPGSGLQARTAPSQRAGVVRTLAHGTDVGIVCHTRGSSVRGPFGLSNVWDRLATGEYVADAYVRTGRKTWRVPAC